MIDFTTKPPMTICKTRVYNMKTEECYISDWEIPTEEYLSSQLEKIDEEISNVENYLRYLKGHKNYCKQCQGIHRRNKQYNIKDNKNETDN